MANRKRDKNIAVRVTGQELTRIKKKVELSKLTQQEYFLRCLLNKDIQIKEGGVEVVKSLKAIGNNVNQIAHKVNAGQISDCSSELKSLYAELRELRITWQ